MAKIKETTRPDARTFTITVTDYELQLIQRGLRDDATTLSEGLDDENADLYSSITQFMNDESVEHI